MWLVFLLLILILGILCSTIEASLYRIELTDKKFDLKLVISLKLYGIIKILHVDCNENGIKFLNKRITYKEIILKAKEDDLNIKKISIDFFDLLKQADLKFKKMYFTLKVGLLEMSLTNIAIIVFSSIFPIFVKSKVKKQNLKYDVLPEYNKILIFLRGKINISVKSLNLIKLYFKNIKPQITHNKIKNCDVKESF